MDSHMLTAVRDQLGQLAGRLLSVATATVVSGSQSRMVVAMDTAPGVNVVATALNGSLPVGARVLVLQVPPRGNVVLGPINTGFSAEYGPVTDAGNTGTAWTVPSNVGIVRATVNGNMTLTLPPAIVGTRVTLDLVQGAAWTVTWPAAIKWDGGTDPVLAATAGRIMVIRLTYDGTDWLGAVDGVNFS